MDVTAVVLSHNDKDKIAKCLKSLIWCKKIIVIDDYSTDGTLETIYNQFSKLKIRIFKHKLDGDFAGQRNFGLSKVKSEWALYVDSDEVVSRLLREEILQKLEKSNQVNGYYIKRRDYFLGVELKHGETGEAMFLRLARKNFGKWKRRIHEYWQPNNISKQIISGLTYPILHYPHESIREFIDDINFYSTIHASENKHEGKKSDVAKIIFYPIGKFVVNYFYKMGFLDGTRGFITATLMSFHSFLGWSKQLWD